jgi:hypothetical protein
MLSAAISAPPVALGEDEDALEDGLCVQRE